MKKKLIIDRKNYTKLVIDLTKILKEGKQNAMETVRQYAIETYWKLGKRITKEEDVVQLNYLAHDLKIEETLLSRIVKFYEFWPRKCPLWHKRRQLSWAHYKQVLGIEDKNQREFYLREASKLSWNHKRLALMIKDNFYSNQLNNKSKKIKSDVKLKRKTDPLYCYSAIVKKVVDGDTLLLNIDLGFDVWLNQRIRLRGIDCPSISTHKGQSAKEFVEHQLRVNDLVVIQTFKKIDIYGRYLVDIFYLQGATDKELIVSKGNFLNQELLNRDLAVLF